MLDTATTVCHRPFATAFLHDLGLLRPGPVDPAVHQLVLAVIRAACSPEAR